MKKLSISLAVAATLGAGVAAAYGVGTTGPGVLVPRAIHSDAEGTTAVAVVNHSTQAVKVYWAFFNPDSTHRFDGDFDLTPNGLHEFNWAAEGPQFKNTPGYLVFYADSAVDRNTPVDADPTTHPLGTTIAGANQPLVPRISASGYQANLAKQDAAYIPMFPIQPGDLAAGTVLTSMNQNTIQTLASGAQAGETIALRYDVSDDFNTKIVVWATGGLLGPVDGMRAGYRDFRDNAGLSQSMNIFRDNQERRSIFLPCKVGEQAVGTVLEPMVLGGQEMCAVDAADITGRPASFNRGVINYVYPGEWGNVGSALSYSVVTSKSFSATQTSLNPHF